MPSDLLPVSRITAVTIRLFFIGCLLSDGIKQVPLGLPQVLGEIHIVPVREFKPLHLVPEGIHLSQAVLLDLGQRRD